MPIDPNQRLSRARLAIGTLAGAAALTGAPAAQAIQGGPSPDARDGGGSVQTVFSTDLRSPDARDGGGTVSAARQPIVVTVTKRGGFDWGDAAIGAGGGAGIVLLVGGLATTASRRRAGALLGAGER
jgi:hypothetical protein